MTRFRDDLCTRPGFFSPQRTFGFFDYCIVMSSPEFKIKFIWTIIVLLLIITAVKEHIYIEAFNNLTSLYLQYPVFKIDGFF